MTTDAEKLLQSLHGPCMGIMLSTGDGTHITSRYVFLMSNPKHGFHINTKSVTRKVAFITKNPHVTFTYTPEGGKEALVVHCSTKITSDPPILTETWDDSLKNFGYAAACEDTRRVILLTVHSITRGRDTIPGHPHDHSHVHLPRAVLPAPLPSGPFRADDAKAALLKAIETGGQHYLLTWCGIFQGACRHVLRFQEEIGFYVADCSCPAEIVRVETNSNAAIHFHPAEATGQLAVDVVCWVERDADILKKVSLKCEKTDGKECPCSKDEKPMILRFAIRNIIVHTPTFFLQGPIVCPTAESDIAVAALHSAMGEKEKVKGLVEMGADHGHGKVMAVEKSILRHPTLGFGMVAKKSDHMGHCKGCCVVKVRIGEVAVEANAMIVECDEYKKVMWEESLKADGFGGPSDPETVFVALNPMKIVG